MVTGKFTFDTPWHIYQTFSNVFSPIYNKSALVEVRAWCWIGSKPWSELTMSKVLWCKFQSFGLDTQFLQQNCLYSSNISASFFPAVQMMCNNNVSHKFDSNSHFTWSNLQQQHVLGVLCQWQVWRTGISNYIPQILWDVITCPCLHTCFCHSTPHITHYGLLMSYGVGKFDHQCFRKWLIPCKAPVTQNSTSKSRTRSYENLVDMVVSGNFWSILAWSCFVRGMAVVGCSTAEALPKHCLSTEKSIRQW